MLLTTEKYADKGMEILREGLEHEPLFTIRNKLTEGASNRESVTLHDLKQPSSGGMMLYTSGTTNRPVSSVRFTVLKDPLLSRSRKVFSSHNRHWPRKHLHY